MPNSNRVIRMPEVLKIVGLKKSTIYKNAAEGTFSKPIRISANASGWLEAEIRAWLDERIAASRAVG